MNMAWVHSLWDRLIHKREFYDTINAPAEDVITAMITLKRDRGLFGMTETDVKIEHENDGYRFLIHLYDRSTSVVVSGRLRQREASQCYWEGYIRDGMILVVILFCCISLVITVGVLSVGQANGNMSLFACFQGVLMVFIFEILSSLGRCRMRKQMTKILDQFNS